LRVNVRNPYPRKTEEICVAVRASFRSIDLIKMFEGKFELRRQGFDSVTQVTFGERRQFVEEWLDNGRIENDQGHLEDQSGTALVDKSSKEQNNKYRKPMSHGTNLSPAHLKTYRKAARNGAPITKPSPQVLNKSPTNRDGVVLLKPCSSSSTNV
jgi:hypothetical protein